MSHVDGNALAGAFADLVSFDITTAVARCAACGAVDELGTAMVYRTDAGTVVRCAGCSAVLVTLVESGERVFVGFRGVTALQVRRQPT